MNKTILISAVLIIVAIALFCFFKSQRGSEEKMISWQRQKHTSHFDGRSSTFTIDGQSVTLVDGITEQAIPNSSATVITRYFGNEATGDLNADGRDDQAFLITQETGGSGTFYYAVVALKTDSGYLTTNAFFIGDRIAPQSTEIYVDSRELHINFADRNPDEPMSAQPSQGKVLLLKVTEDNILEGLMK